MKIKESQLRTIIRNVLQESLFNDKINYNSLDDVTCRIYVIEPQESLNIGHFFNNNYVIQNYGNPKNYVKQTFEKIKKFFDENKEDFMYVYVGYDNDDRIVIFDDVDPSPQRKSKDKGNDIKEHVGYREIVSIINKSLPECINYVISNKESKPIRYNIKELINNDSFKSIHNNTFYRKDVRYSYIFTQKGKLQIPLKRAIELFIPSEYQQDVFEEIEYDFQQEMKEREISTYYNDKNNQWNQHKQNQLKLNNSNYDIKQLSYPYDYSQRTRKSDYDGNITNTFVV